MVLLFREYAKSPTCEETLRYLPIYAEKPVIGQDKPGQISLPQASCKVADVFSGLKLSRTLLAKFPH